MSDPGRLTVEEPVILSLKITKMFPSAVRLSFYIKEEETITMAINSIAPKVCFEI